MIPNLTRRPAIRARITGEIFARQRFGGVSRYCVELARELNRLELASAHIDNSIHINEYLWKHRREVNNHGIFLSRDTRTAARLCRATHTVKSRLLGRSRYEIVHLSSYGYEQFNGRVAANVCTFYDMIRERYAPDERLFQRKKRCLQKADRCIAISEATKADMVHYLGANPENIDVIYLASRMSLPEQASFTVGRQLLWVGARKGYKNFETFVQGFVRSRAAEEGIMIVCAGGPQFTSQERERWHELGLAPERVQHLQPSDEELAVLYARSLALVYASLYEGFGIPPLEAMMCNCPVIASEAGSIPEVVEDAALRFDPTSAEAIAYQIDRLLQSSQLADELRRRGRTQAMKFSWERCAIETQRCYLSAMQSSIANGSS